MNQTPGAVDCRKPWPVLLALVLLSFASLGFGPPKLTDSAAPRIALYQEQYLAAISNVPPPVQGTAELIMDYATGKIVFQRNSHAHVAPASTTKVMTAIVALEKGKLTDKITISQRDLTEGSGMGIIPGDVLTLEDLLWGLLLPSGNDSALAIADLVGGGSIENFVKMMNDKAAEMGLQDTHFVNPHGLDEDDHYTSAYDLAIMSRYALGKPAFANMVATTYHTVQATRTFYLQNANQLLRQQNAVPGVDGVKTGMTDNAGDCLIASVTRDGHRVIVVAMGTKDRAYVATQLINYAFNNFEWVEMPKPFVNATTDRAGQKWATMVGEKREEMIFPWQKPFIRYVLQLTGDEAAYAANSVVGSATYSIDGTSLVNVPLRIASGGK